MKTIKQSQCNERMLLREAPLRSRVQNKKCPFVLRNKVIHFCGRHIGGGGHMELLTGSLTHRFFGIPKVDPPKRALRLSIRRSRVPFFGPQKVTFLQNIAKTVLAFSQGAYAINIALFRTDDVWRALNVDTGLVVRSVTVCNGLNNVFYFILRLLFQASRPCRARCI